jgi:hypothetical protein
MISFVDILMFENVTGRIAKQMPRGIRALVCTVKIFKMSQLPEKQKPRLLGGLGTKWRIIDHLSRNDYGTK